MKMDDINKINKSFKICVIGQVKSGKSSFYNMLFGSDILPTKQEDCSYGTMNIIDSKENILYENDNEIDISKYNNDELREEILRIMNKHREEKSKLEMILKRNIAGLKYKFIQFIDTQGLEDEHIEVKNYEELVKEVDSCFYVLSYPDYCIKRNRKEIIKNIHEIYNINENVIFIVTNFDRYETKEKDLKNILNELYDNMNKKYKEINNTTIFKFDDNNVFCTIYNKAKEHEYYDEIRKKILKKIDDIAFKSHKVLIRTQLEYVDTLYKKIIKSCAVKFENEYYVAIPRDLENDYEEYEKERHNKYIKENIGTLKNTIYNILTIGENIFVEECQKIFFDENENKKINMNKCKYLNKNHGLHFCNDNEIIKKHTFGNLDFFNKKMCGIYALYNTFRDFKKKKCDLDKDYKYEIMAIHLNKENRSVANDIIKIVVITKSESNIIGDEYSIVVNDYKFCDVLNIDKNTKNITFYKLDIGSKKIFSGTMKKKSVVKENRYSEIEYSYDGTHIFYCGEYDIMYNGEITIQ
jgi:hypothetical protein